MGADGWGPTRVPKPPKPVTTEDMMTEGQRRQRQDDRRIEVGSRAAAAASSSGVSWVALGRQAFTANSGASFAQLDTYLVGVWLFTINVSALSGTVADVTCFVGNVAVTANQHYGNLNASGLVISDGSTPIGWQVQASSSVSGYVDGSAVLIG